LIREPERYLRAERAAVVQTLMAARRSSEDLAELASTAGLPAASLERHREVIAAEIARTATFLELLDSAQPPPGEVDGSAGETRPSGWALDGLLPYLLRDWSDSGELGAAAARIDAALAAAFPDRSAASVVFAGCGAGGALAAIRPGFARILGFDLTFPVLLAARRLLDGAALELALPRCIHPTGSMRLQRRAAMTAADSIELAAMDAFDTAFASGSVDCVVTSFLLDLIPDPRRLGREIHRIVRSGGLWLNYGPSGPLKALWRFDRPEARDFVEALGFTVTQSDQYRTTYLDLSRDCPAWSFQNHVCYLTCARKSA
jgi:SAM-dependent methyltransferase